MTNVNIIAEANFRYAEAIKKNPSKRFFMNDGSRIDQYENLLVIWNGGHLTVQFDMNSNVYSVELR